ncbi:hypothetical protein [Nocardioides acrostichi]|uniref:Uncharacterized protein n=1 Tax=Nocardioides acrostichi TaxID=2784339 RepID=A0A930UZH4_9ACTN|nr:hypothetical protein [Nocardioides acrostichi]MBF4162597.1 hypothetical protein [Nocardioides acrostichi]
MDADEAATRGEIDMAETTEGFDPFEALAANMQKALPARAEAVRGIDCALEKLWGVINVWPDEGNGLSLEEMDAVGDAYNLLQSLTPLRERSDAAEDWEALHALRQRTQAEDERAAIDARIEVLTARLDAYETDGYEPAPDLEAIRAEVL